MAVKNRIEYYDTLRALAILAVIAIHALQVWGNKPQILGFPIFTFVEAVGFAVPIFLMLSGALLLGRDIELESFLKRRMVRITTPFIFYIIILFAIYFSNGWEISYNIFSYYWYFWLIVGVYLAIPIINKFIQHATRREIEYFLAVFLLASIFYQIILYLGVNDQFFDLNFFVSPIGYLILGYYLAHYDFKLDSRKIVVISGLVFLAVTLIKMLGSLNMLPSTLIFDLEATQTKVVMSWLDMSIFKILQAGSLFLLFKNLKFDSDIFKKFTLSVSRASYGMYLMDYIIRINIVPFFVAIPSTGTEVCLCIVGLTLTVFILSWVIVLVFSRIPVVREFCGYN